MIEAVVLDFDDTLSLTEAISFDIENAALERMGRPPMSRAAHLETWEMRPAEAIPLRSPGVDVGAFKAICDSVRLEYRDSGRLDAIPQENYDALDALVAQGRAVMVLTSRTREGMNCLLDSNHPLTGKVKAFYYRENCRFRKPDPRVFDGLLADAGLLPGQCAYVGDSPRDAKAAKGAGLHFVASLESGLRNAEDFNEVRVDAFIGRFPEIVSAVRSLEASQEDFAARPIGLFTSAPVFSSIEGELRK